MGVVVSWLGVRLVLGGVERLGGARDGLVGHQQGSIVGVSAGTMSEHVCGAIGTVTGPSDARYGRRSAGVGAWREKLPADGAKTSSSAPESAVGVIILCSARLE